MILTQKLLNIFHLKLQENSAPFLILILKPSADIIENRDIF